MTSINLLPLIRLRYGGSAFLWGFGFYLAGSGKNENQIRPTGLPWAPHKKPSTAPATSTSATNNPPRRTYEADHLGSRAT